jgi:hypothetical protein
MRLSVPSVYLLALVAGPMAAQGSNGVESHSVHEAMAAMMAANPHMRMTAKRPMTPGDSARAMALADTIRRAISKYADTSAAVLDGFKLFAPNVKQQKTLHYTKWGNSVSEVFRWNPAKPTSLLYERDESGHLKLVGAMYTLPKRASETRLNERIPLSVTSWHQHINLCLPPKGEEARLAEKQNGKPIFGVEGSITAKGPCEAAGGRFWDTLFGWMVHANVFKGNDLATVWGEDHGPAGHDHKP